MVACACSLGKGKPVRKLFFAFALLSVMPVTVAAASEARTYCYREDMSELKITTFGDATAEFEVESAQGGAHICGLAGKATSLVNGYRYVEEIEGVGRCELSILFADDDSVSFTDPDWICKQYYCGARAAFEHIQFGNNARVTCD